MSAVEQPPTTVDRAIPSELVDLAVLAIRRGAERVSLVHEGLGADFPAPIGWLLWISRGEGDTAMLSHQIGSPRSDIALPDWLTRQTDEAPVDEHLVELFRAAVAVGWSVTYDRRTAEHESRLAAFRGLDAPLPEPRHHLEANAFAWAYDDAARARGEQLSTRVTVSRTQGEVPDPLAFIDAARVEESLVATLLASPAPGTRPVAYFDDAIEEWVL